MKTNNLNPKYTFDNFIVGNSNKFAHSVAIAVVKEPGKFYNPFFLYGNDGLGKTHLIQAIGNEILKKFPEQKVLYISSNEFIFDIIQAIKNNDTIEKLYTSKYASFDVLLLDDIQFIAGKEKVQEELFYIINKMYENEKKIILTSDRQPKYISKLEDRLLNRFECGLFANISMPDFETKVKIMKNYARSLNFDIDVTILLKIATFDNLNIRELEGILNQLLAISTFNNGKITMDIVDKCVDLYNK